MSEFTKAWFEEAKNLSYEEALYIRVANKKEQTSVMNDFIKEKEEYEAVDPELAGQLFINRSTKDMKFYVVIERKYRTVFSAFKRDATGNFTKISIEPERRRMIMLMLSDDKTRKEIEEILGELTEQEVQEFF
ncbi:hypothetical protein KO465_04885 [Candidatus Micrarchaeota archaeon]|nr:hypothetical protein [Candidatus Micrarchaeota archaeon]